MKVILDESGGVDIKGFSHFFNVLVHDIVAILFIVPHS